MLDWPIFRTLDGTRIPLYEGTHVEGAEQAHPTKGELPDVESKEAATDFARLMLERGELWRLVG
jgi:hypothetical protein